MKLQPNLDELFSAWQAQPLPATRSAPTREGSLAVARALRDVARRQRRRRLLRRASIAVAAGVFAIGIGVWLYERPAASLAERQPSTQEGGAGQRGAGNVVTLSDSRGDVFVTDVNGNVLVDVPRLTEGYAVRTLEGSASLGFPSGAVARLARASVLKLTATERTESLLLTRGRVDVEVPKLDRERGFAVETPDARVVVHGTGFSVSVAPEDERGIRTAVSVTHGVVAVEHDGHEVRLSAGQHWPEDYEPSWVEGGDGASLDRDDASQQPALDKPRVKPGGKARRARRAPSARESRELAEQNGHFARAMLLKNQGRPQRALDELTHLLSSHPSSPLRQEARVERLRILRGLGRLDEARSEARHYLTDFPDGYAAREARELFEEP